MRRIPGLSLELLDRSAPPRCRGTRCARQGISLVELLVVLAIIAVVASIVIPVVGRVRNNARSAKCLLNLSSIGAAFRMYTELNGDAFPNPIDTATQWEDIITPDANRSMYCCPADNELFNAVGSSYDWRDTGDESTTLAGKSLSTDTRQDAVLSFDALPGWHSPKTMNAVLIDGSAISMDRDACMKDLLKPPTMSVH